MIVLGIETSCDETSVAILKKEKQIEILHHQIASQIEQHRPFGGVVPELATRQHLLRLDPMIQQAEKESGVSIRQLDGIAVTRGPGLSSSLLVGLSYAKGLAFSYGKKWIGINHLEGHIYSPFLEQKTLPTYPHLALIVSGGHTLLIHAREAFVYEKIGSTLDDAAGEAFDKVAKMLALPYPGGPEIEKEARNGNAEAIAFPRSMIGSGDYHFSFSGLKTSVRTFLEKKAVKTKEEKADVCASFQQAVIDVLIRKTCDAAKDLGVNTVTMSGGVSCNQTLRQQMKTAVEKQGATFLSASPVLSTDNAAMITAVALNRFQAGEVESWDTDVNPNLRLA